ncbi:CMRF35-like molecule 6 [Esox lucius]|uniref:CMRF35-like molecule 6 n=1 Tax=Esox lucius TaxID=8010 RepID=UPI001476A91E|nr:CMRF35-like molecule 6 [Esox lucius]
MEKVFLAMVTILLALCPAGSEVLTVTGVVGGQVVIKCKHTFASINDKYFCKDSCTGSDILIRTRDNKNYTENGRYSIFDFRNGVVTVTIKDLKKSDSGTYWCGVERVLMDSYQEVFLRVEEGPPTPLDISSPHPFSTVNRVAVSLTTVPGTPQVIMLCVSLTVLMFGLILFLIYNWQGDGNVFRPVTNSDTTILESTYQTLKTAPQDSTYQTLNTTPQDSL